MGKRGSYVKGVAKRQEILTTALTVIAEHGYSRASVKQLAQAVNLSQAGLLHYFGSKEQLFEEVLRARDEQSLTSSANPEDVVLSLQESARYNAEVPGLVRLFSALSTAAAVDDHHTSREYFTDRYASLVIQLSSYIRAGQESGTFRTDVDADACARIIIATSDGLQTQWLLNQDIVMSDDVDALISGLLLPPSV